MWGVTLFLILGFAYFLNATDFLSKPLSPEAPKQDGKSAGPSVAQTSESMKEHLKKSKNPGTIEAASPDGEVSQGIPSEPAIFKKKEQRYKPAYNPTSTSSHWDDEESYNELKSEEVKKERGF